MSKSRAQRLVASIGGPQTVEINPNDSRRSVAQPLTVTLSTPQQVVIINPARKNPTE